MASQALLLAVKLHSSESIVQHGSIQLFAKYIRGFYFQGQFLLHEAAPGENFTMAAGVFTPTAVEEFTKPFASRFFKIPIDGRPLPAEIVVARY